MSWAAVINALSLHRSRSNRKQSGETSFLPNQLLPERSLSMNPSYSTGLQGMNMQSTLQRRQMAARADPEDYPLFNLKGISFEDNCVWSAPFLTCSEGDDVRIRRLHRTTPWTSQRTGSFRCPYCDASSLQCQNTVETTGECNDATSTRLVMKSFTN